MTIKDFFETNEYFVIHCDTEEKATRLLKEFDRAGYRWSNRSRYVGDSRWHLYRENTCYSNTGGYAHIDWYKTEGWRVLEFEEIEFESTEGRITNNDLVNTQCAECEHRNVCGLKKGLENLILILLQNHNQQKNYTMQL